MSLATRARTAVGRLEVLHNIYAPAGRKALLAAGLVSGMHVADFRMRHRQHDAERLASMVGPSGSAIGVDLHGEQLQQARELSAQEGLMNVAYFEADACNTGLGHNSFDPRVLPLPAAPLTRSDPGGIREMKAVLKPGRNILVVEDGDLASGRKALPSSRFGRTSASCSRGLGRLRGVDYSIENRLCKMVADGPASSASACMCIKPAETRRRQRTVARMEHPRDRASLDRGQSHPAGRAFGRRSPQIGGVRRPIPTWLAIAPRIVAGVGAENRRLDLALTNDSRAGTYLALTSAPSVRSLAPVLRGWHAPPLRVAVIPALAVGSARKDTPGQRPASWLHPRDQLGGDIPHQKRDQSS